MGWFDNHQAAKDSETYNNVAPHEHEAKLSHEVVSGAAAFEAAKAYNDHCKRNGKPDSHSKAKEVFAGLSGAAVDRMVETKGLNFIDKEKAKRHAEKHGEEKLAGEY